jgi:exopolysaccharide biosynthesis predicted pyruvyltransferase EpsI
VSAAAVERIGSTLSQALDEQIPAGSRVALLDYPNHENVGDSAIWLGELAYLRNRGCRIVYHCDLRSYATAQLARAEPDLVLLHGGGNLGDLWEPHQLFRQRVLEEHPGRRIVQLPQTIHFLRQEKIAETRRAFSGHPDFTLLVRDSRSLEFAEAELGCPVEACPDSAFALGVLRRGAPRSPVLWLGRTDHEAAAGSGGVPGGGDVELADWIGRASAPPVDRATRIGGELLATAAGSLPVDVPRLQQLLWRTWVRLASNRVEAGVAMLSRGEVVVTDRLHGHILCLLAAIPHVLLDNSYGKLSSYASTWDTLGDDAVWSDSPVDALARARALAER